MREILYRGRKLDKEEWLEGSLLVYPDGDCFICCSEGKPHELIKYEVAPFTVGQYTGLQDKNGVRIFEGDIISYNDSREVVYFDIGLRIPCFTTGVGRGSSTAPHPYKISKRHVVIGNIHDNPELLEGGQYNA